MKTNHTITKEGNAFMIDQNTNHMEYQPGMEQIGSEIQDAVISKMNE